MLEEEACVPTDYALICLRPWPQGQTSQVSLCRDLVLTGNRLGRQDSSGVQSASVNVFANGQ